MDFLKENEVSINFLKFFLENFDDVDEIEINDGSISFNLLDETIIASLIPNLFQIKLTTINTLSGINYDEALSAINEKNQSNIPSKSSIMVFDEDICLENSHFITYKTGLSPDHLTYGIESIFKSTKFIINKYFSQQ